MKQSALRQFEVGSAKFVVEHAGRQRSRGKAPSMPFILERNPRKALVFAHLVIRQAHLTETINSLGPVILGRNTYHNMGDSQIEIAARHIICDSYSEDEARRRLKEELGYPFEIDLHTSVPTDATGREARELVRALGGLVMKNGAMASAMLQGHDDWIDI